jgi:mannosyltransferase OCH1-like enzyme
MDAEVIENDHHARSDFVRNFVQCSRPASAPPLGPYEKPPRRIIQFWNDLDRLPKDVEGCIDSWSKLKAQGFEIFLFDECRARAFIAQRLGNRYEQAYDRCYHPAMQSDYFRLCYILVEGGLYVDADDVYQGMDIDYLFTDSRLKVNPLCYDSTMDRMVPHSVFIQPGSNSSGWIFYFNNNPLIAGRNHPLVQRALSSATTSIERQVTGIFPEIQSTTGPGNLTKSIFAASAEHRLIEENLVALRNWESVATSMWPLSYRTDARNWRLSNQRGFLE